MGCQQEDQTAERQEAEVSLSSCVPSILTLHSSALEVCLCDPHQQLPCPLAPSGFSQWGLHRMLGQQESEARISISL